MTLSEEDVVVNAADSDDFADSRLRVMAGVRLGLGDGVLLGHPGDVKGFFSG